MVPSSLSSSHDSHHPARLVSKIRSVQRLPGQLQCCCDDVRAPYEISAIQEIHRCKHIISAVLRICAKTLIIFTFCRDAQNAHKDPQLNGKTLLTLLQAPAGCITRYVQLLSKLFEATSPMHPDYAGLRASKQRITDIFAQMNKK